MILFPTFDKHKSLEIIIACHDREVLHMEPRERLETEGLPVKVSAFPFFQLVLHAGVGQRGQGAMVPLNGNSSYSKQLF